MSLLVDTRYVVISQGTIPWHKRIIAAVFLTAVVYCIFQMVYGVFYLDEVNVLYLYGSGFFLYYGFLHAHSRNFVFDFKKNRFRDEVQIGFIKFGWWEKMPTLEYVSVYRKRENDYRLKIFYSINEGYEIAGFRTAESGIKAAKQVAKKLDIDCWDGTIPGDGDWIEMD